MQNSSLNGNGRTALPKEKPLRHTSLHSGTALAAWVAAGVFSPLSVEQALAACTAAPNIVCDDASYPTGLSYTNQNGDRTLTVTNPGGTTIGSTAGTGAGVTLTQGGSTARNFTVTIENSASSITTNNNARVGINVTNGGNIVISNAASIQTGGSNSTGVNAVSTAPFLDFSSKDVTVVTNGDVTTTGANSTGINAQRRASLAITTIDGIGNVSVTAKNVSATGTGSSDGINATTGTGNVTVVAGTVTATRNGINATTATGDVAVTAAAVTAAVNDGVNATSGSGDVGVSIDGDVNAGRRGINSTTNFGSVDVTAGDVTAGTGFGVNATTNFGLGLSDLGGLIGDLDPDNIDPLALLDLGGVTVDVGEVQSTGFGINAVVAGGSALGYTLPGIGNVNVSAADVRSTQGFGINAKTGLGLVTVSAGDVEAGLEDTLGVAADDFGVNAQTGLGLASVTVGDVTARGQGINAEVTGFQIPSIPGILPDGLDLPGIGIAYVNAGDVTSTEAGGVNATTGIGVAIVLVGDVDSFGVGVNAEADTGVAFALADDVTTEDDGATGMNVAAGGVAVAVSTGHVQTEGDYAYGVNVAADPLGDLSILDPFLGTIDGALADLGLPIGTADILSAVEGGIAIAVVNDVSTAGAGSLGVNAVAYEGIAGVLATGTVSTTNTDAHGIQAIGAEFAGVIANDVSATGVGSQGIFALSNKSALVVADTVLSNSRGIQALGGEGFVGVAARDVETTGADDAGGIYAYLEGSGDVYVAAGTVNTVGTNSTGIHGHTEDGSTYIVAGDVVTTGDGSGGIVNEAHGTSFTLFGNVTTGGNNAPAVTATDDPSDVIVIGGTATTSGTNSAGILADSNTANVWILVDEVSTGAGVGPGDNSLGISGTTDTGNVFVGAGRVSTRGAGSDGIIAETGDGDATVLAGSVSTLGLGSDGIRALAGNGDATVIASAVSTEGDYATGIEADAGQDAFVLAGPVTTSGERSHGIVATAEDGDAEVLALGAVSATGMNARGIDARSENGSALVVVVESVQGGDGPQGAGVRFGGETGATLVNLGSIGAESDRAIVNDDRDSEVHNFGDVTGFVQMNSGADTFYNYEGARFIARGDSDFGDDEDVFYNSGTFTMADRAVATTVNVTGLEVFDNSDDGIVELRNDIVGDIVNLVDSDFVGGGLFAIDAELTPGGTADQLHIGGDLTGVTSLAVNDVDGGPGQYDPDGILFAIVNGTTDDTNFTTNGGIDKGLFRYDAYLRPDDPNVGGDNGWYLASTLDREAYEFPIIAAGAQNLWHASTGTWLDRTADLRSAFVAAPPVVDLKNEGPASPAPGTMTPGAWLKVFGGTQERDISNVSAPPAGMSGPGYAYDDVFTQRHYGFMVGIDGGREGLSENGANEAWLAGVMAGYTGSDLDFDNSSTDVDYKMGSIGGYVTYLNGGFFADAALKADFGRIDYSSNLGGGVSDSFKSDFTSVGVILDTGYRINNTGGWFFEPKATLAYVHTSFDDASVAGTNVAMENGDSLRGRLGGRVGTQFNSNGNIIEPYLEASIWHEFDADYTATLSGSSFSVPVSYDLGGTYGEVAGGASFINIGNGWSGFTKGSVQFGSDSYLGLSANLGVRKTW